ncbi:hypothetical protein CF70_032500 [Cupriavidus sp. SK-3]|nr:hypothetical protein CF70_032500 [Cupriavidus sp. SK-3]
MPVFGFLAVAMLLPQIFRWQRALALAEADIAGGRTASRDGMLPPVIECESAHTRRWPRAAKPR